MYYLANNFVAFLNKLFYETKIYIEPLFNAVYE